jgi:hypothetical protein
MERKFEIEKELSGVAPDLGKMGIASLPYRAPAGYFERFPDVLLSRIRSGHDLLLPELATTSFETGLEELNPLVEIQDIAPLLAKLDKKTPYRTPDGYFEDFRISLAEPVIPSLRPTEKNTKVIPLRSTRFLRYAVAALFAGVVATTAFFAIHTPAADPLNGLTNVSDQEMSSFLDNQDVHWVPDAAPAAAMASVNFNDNDISDLLSNVSDTELEQYLPDLPDQKQTIN